MVMAIVAVLGIATGVIISKGATATVLPVMLGVLIIFGFVWVGGFQVGAAFADWLEKRWYR